MATHSNAEPAKFQEKITVLNAEPVNGKEMVSLLCAEISLLHAKYMPKKAEEKYFHAMG